MMSRDDAQDALQQALLRGGRPSPDLWDIWLWSGADINTPSDHNGKTALMMAAQTGDAEITDYLLSRGARPDLQNANNGETALMYAARVGMAGHIAVIDRLLAKGADPALRDHAGKMAADHAAKGTALQQRLLQLVVDRCRDEVLSNTAYKKRQPMARQRFRIGK